MIRREHQERTNRHEGRIEAADTNEKIEAILPELDVAIGDGLVALERVEVRVYRASGE